MTKRTVNVHMPGAQVGSQIIGDHAVVNSAPAAHIDRVASPGASQPDGGLPDPRLDSGSLGTGVASRAHPGLPLAAVVVGNLLGLGLVLVGASELVGKQGAAVVSKIEFMGLTLQSADRALVVLALGLVSATAVNLAALRGRKPAP